MQGLVASFSLRIETRQTKKCDKCRQYKAQEYFSKATKQKDGLQRTCKACNKEYVKQNRDRISEWNKKNWADNKERLSADGKQYRQDNLEKVREQDRLSKQRNKEAVRLRKQKYYQENKDTIHTKDRIRYHEDPLFKMRSNVANSIRNAFNTIKRVKKCPTFELLGYPKEYLYEYLQQYMDKPCQRCGSIIITRENSVIDHIIPIRLAETEQDIVELFHYSNLRLIDKSCNESKNGLLDFDNAVVNLEMFDKFVKPRLEEQNE